MEDLTARLSECTRALALLYVLLLVCGCGKEELKNYAFRLWLKGWLGFEFKFCSFVVLSRDERKENVRM